MTVMCQQSLRLCGGDTVDITEDQLLWALNASKSCAFFGEWVCRGHVWRATKDQIDWLSNENSQHILSPSQTGRTTTLILMILWRMTFKSNCNMVFISQNRESLYLAKSMFEKELVNLPAFIRPKLIHEYTNAGYYETDLHSSIEFRLSSTTFPGNSTEIAFVDNTHIIGRQDMKVLKTESFPKAKIWVEVI